MKILASLLIGLSMMLPMASTAMADAGDLNVRAAKLGLPFYHEWAWQDDGVTMRYAFPNGFKGLVEICENYLTPENLKKVIDAKAFDSESMNTVLQGTKQSVDGWK